MKEDGQTPPNFTVICGRCGTACDPEDNFCRHCGLVLHDPQLPAVRNGRDLPVAWRPPVPAVVVKGAAFIAAGTLAEIALRRLVRRAFLGDGGNSSRRNAHPARRGGGQSSPEAEALPEDTQMVSETVLLRRVRFRR